MRNCQTSVSGEERCARWIICVEGRARTLAPQKKIGFTTLETTERDTSRNVAVPCLSNPRGFISAALFGASKANPCSREGGIISHRLRPAHDTRERTPRNTQPHRQMRASAIDGCHTARRISRMRRHQSVRSGRASEKANACMSRQSAKTQQVRVLGQSRRERADCNGCRRCSAIVPERPQCLQRCTCKTRWSAQGRSVR